MTDKKPVHSNPDDFDPISMGEFEEAVKQVLFAPVNKKDKAKYENRKPTKEELGQKWKLEKDQSDDWKMRETLSVLTD